jgi:hypothetical protein
MNSMVECYSDMGQIGQEVSNLIKRWNQILLRIYLIWLYGKLIGILDGENQ